MSPSTRPEAPRTTGYPYWATSTPPIASNSNEQLVLDFLSLVLKPSQCSNAVDRYWSDSSESYYVNMPDRMTKFVGKEAIKGALEGFLRVSKHDLWETIHIGSNKQGQVFTERIDRIRMNGRAYDLQIVGVFEVNDGKILEWRDHFCAADFDHALETRSRPPPKPLAKL